MQMLTVQIKLLRFVSVSCSSYLQLRSEQFIDSSAHANTDTTMFVSVGCEPAN